MDRNLYYRMTWVSIKNPWICGQKLATHTTLVGQNMATQFENLGNIDTLLSSTNHTPSRVISTYDSRSTIFFHLCPRKIWLAPPPLQPSFYSSSLFTSLTCQFIPKTSHNLVFLWSNPSLCFAYSQEKPKTNRKISSPLNHLTLALKEKGGNHHLGALVKESYIL